MEKLAKILPLTKAASKKLAKINDTTKRQVLDDLATAILNSQATIIKANQKDQQRMDKTDPRFDRLVLTESRIADMIADLRHVATLESPLDKIIEARTLPNNLHLSKISVPLGIVGIIYEARPNVTLDVFSLCFKSGNVALLKGGSDAEFSNQAIMNVIQEVLKVHNIDPYTAYLLSTDRGEVLELLHATDFVDVIIPRGSQALIDFVKDNARVPIIETGAGIVHTYVDASANLETAKNIILNEKTRRPSVCNALDTLIIHQQRLSDLPELTQLLAEHHVEIFADDNAYAALKTAYPKSLLHYATPEHFGTEFLSLKMSIKTVNDLPEALTHIATYSSRHSECIVAEDKATIETFLSEVDAAVVYANAATSFTDGAQFGLGAEIGISTQKLHARGPMGLKELTTYKWIVRGDGQVRA